MTRRALLVVSGGLVVALLAVAGGAHFAGKMAKQGRLALFAARTGVPTEVVTEAAASSRLSELLAELRAVRQEQRAMIVSEEARQKEYALTRPPETPEEATARWQARMDDSERSRKYFTGRRAKLKFNYGAFFRREGIAEESCEKAIEAMLRHEMDIVDLQAAKLALDPTEGRRPEVAAALEPSPWIGAVDMMAWTDPAVNAVLERLKAERKAALESIMGEGADGRLRQFERTIAIWEGVNQFAGGATLSGWPLSDRQIDKLVGTLLAADEQYRRGGPAFPGNVDWAVAENEAKAILSPAQWTFFVQTDLVRGGWRGSLEKEIRAAIMPQKQKP